MPFDTFGTDGTNFLKKKRIKRKMHVETSSEDEISDSGDDFSVYLLDGETDEYDE